MSAERYRWRGELSRRMCDRLSQADMSHARLAAAADVSVAAVRDALNPVAAPPPADVLRRMTAALGLASEELTQWNVLRDRADADGRPVSAHLSSYLLAARRAARELPYPGTVPGAIPPLPAIYATLAACRYSEDGVASPLHRHTACPVTAEALLGQGQDCVLLGGPGSGKSMFLRAGLAAIADRWLAGDAGTAVPVFVPASYLTKEQLPLPEALAAAVSTDLSDMGLAGPLPASFFQLEPVPGVPWLLLVDGLDEIADVGAPWRARNTIAANKDDAASPYRFVITARSRESVQLGRNLPRYELQPLTAGDLPGFAERWFTALRCHDPQDMALSFASALDQAHLTELARTPLTATMLCQLYAAAPAEALPGGRGQVYRQFTRLLRDRQRDTGIDPETRSALRRHGQQALTKAQHTLSGLQPLLARLASQQRTGNTELTVDLVASQPDAARPEHVPPELWTRYLGEILRHSGLMTTSAGGLAFLHQTFGDYLAAAHIAGGQDAATWRAYQDVFGRREAKGRRRRNRAWLPPRPDNDSFHGFLIDAFIDTPGDPIRALKRSAVRDLPGCRFVMAQKSLGTRLPASLIASATDALARWAANPAEPRFERYGAVTALVASGDTRGLAVLTAMASDPESDDGFWAARLLADLGDPSGYDALMLLGTSLVTSWRFAAIRTLAELGDPRAPDLLAAMSADTAVGIGSRHYAAEELARLGDPRGSAALASIAADTSHDGSRRRQAAKTLAELGDQRGPDTLASMAADTGLDSSRRRRAAKALAELGDPRGPAALAEMATDPGLDQPWPRRAAEALAVFGDQRGIQALTSMAANTELDNASRHRAAQALAQLALPAPAANDVVADR